MMKMYSIVVIINDLIVGKNYFLIDCYVMIILIIILIFFLLGVMLLIGNMLIVMIFIKKISL